jgi:DNA-binding transcriptional ArsR family regulator
MTTTTKPKPARGGVAHVPTDRERLQVELMVAGGMTLDDIAMALGISRKTLSKHFAPEIEHGKAKVRGKLTSQVMALALGGDKPMLCFVLKTQFGWKETAVQEHVGKEGGPLTVIKRVIVDPVATPTED